MKADIGIALTVSFGPVRIQLPVKLIKQWFLKMVHVIWLQYLPAGLQRWLEEQSYSPFSALERTSLKEDRLAFCKEPDSVVY